MGGNVGIAVGNGVDCSANFGVGLGVLVSDAPLLVACGSLVAGLSVGEIVGEMVGAAATTFGTPVADAAGVASISRVDVTFAPISVPEAEVFVVEFADSSIGTLVD